MFLKPFDVDVSCLLVLARSKHVGKKGLRQVAPVCNSHELVLQQGCGVQVFITTNL